MAYDDSEALQPDNSYGLGGYTFDLNVSYIHEPDEDLVAISAICNGPDGRRESAPIYVPNGATVESWYVEANETEASVYAFIKYNQPSGAIPCITIACDTPEDSMYFKGHRMASPLASSLLERSTFLMAGFYLDSGTLYVTKYGNTWYYGVLGEDVGKTVREYYTTDPTGSGSSGAESSSTARNTYQRFHDLMYLVPRISVPEAGEDPTGKAVVSPEPAGEDGERLVARFAIDLREADGGPDGDWDEPGDVGPDPEKHFTLTVSVTGASSGSNSGIPLEAGQAGGYGDGGTGGNGGGGGAGASTVIIWDFATSKADNVVQEATARGPGTGGPGGKGGKGGDGCILIFY